MMARMSRRQQPAFPAEQQVVEAMPLLADHQHRAHRLGGGVQAPLHRERLGEVPQLQPQVFVGDLVAGELHAHEKQAGAVVVVLGGFLDVAAALQQEPETACTMPVRSGQDRFRT
jgi:hypothetical protein